MRFIVTNLKYVSLLNTIKALSLTNLSTKVGKHPRHIMERRYITGYNIVQVNPSLTSWNSKVGKNSNQNIANLYIGGSNIVKASLSRKRWKLKVGKRQKDITEIQYITGSDIVKMSPYLTNWNIKIKYPNGSKSIQVKKSLANFNTHM